MYQDINGKIGTRMLQGNEKLYGNTALFEPEEIEDMLADGIVEYAVEEPEEVGPTLEQIKEISKKTVNEIRDQVLKTLTVELDGVTYDADEKSISNINGTVSAINAGVIPVPDPLPWRDADNTTQTLSHAKILELAGLMFNEVQAIYQTSWDLKEDIDAAEDEAEIAAVVWPGWNPWA